MAEELQNNIISPDTDSQSGKPDTVRIMTSPQTAKSGTLYVVATPIGNLRDITLRALDILSSVSHILAEDTRQSRRLLEAYDIKTSLSAYHDHNVAKRIPGILDGLAAGDSYALISDAGTPLVSDPGFKLARAALEAGHPVRPLPGASAVLGALVMSGLPSDIFTFCGFLAAKPAARLRALEGFATLPGTLIFYETGPRIAASLTDMKTVLGDRSAALAREITKKYEEVRRGTLTELITNVTDTPPRGELVVVLGPRKAESIWDEKKVDAVLQGVLVEMGMKRASTHVAGLSGWVKRDVYQRALKLKS